MRLVLRFLSVLGVVSASSCAVSAATVEYLRCEYRVDPLGIGETAPRLSWEMQDPRRGAKQSAYQILVAGTPEKLAANQGDLWDSGKVDSNQTTQVVYAGKPLGSRMRCHWKVRLWNHEGKPSAWSAPAIWTMGLLRPEDFRAKWIGYEPSGDPPQYSLPALDGCKWVWFPDAGNPRAAAPVGQRCFRGKFTLPEKKIRKAYFVFVVDDHGEVIFNGRWIGVTDGGGAAKCIDVADYLEPGRNCIGIVADNRGGGLNPAGLAGKLVVTFDDGQEAVFCVNSQWKASNELRKDPDFIPWLQGENTWGPWLRWDYDDSQWQAAKELGPVVEKIAVVFHPPRGCPLLRKEFEVEQPIRRATLHASALGTFRMHLNGRTVGNDFLSPGWTDFHKRVYYNTYDVTELVKKGHNAIGGILGPGWYAGPVSTIDQGAVYGPYPRLIAQLEIELANGQRRTIATDGSWKGAAGPFVQGENYNGEIYDATREIAGWDQAGLDDAKWRAVHVQDKVNARLDAFPSVLVQETGLVQPVKVTEPRPGRYVFDLGQNMGGVPRLKVSGPRGTQVELHCGERLNPDGTVYRANLRMARCLDKYTLRGSGEEIYQPQFTFRSFQYVEVRGYPGKPAPVAITGVALNSATPLVSSFECSDPMLNKLFNSIVWTQRANYLSIPTDCPNREERLGWMGDAQTYIRTAAWNADVAAFFTKWLVDVDDAQDAAGAFSQVSPRYWDNEQAPGGWGDAGVICPATMFWVYNDRRLLERNYPAMVGWVEFCKANSDHLLRPSQGYGDWLALGAATPVGVMTTAFFAESTRLTALAARALGREEDAKKYMRLFEEIKTAFNKAFVSADGRIIGNTQTCYALALDFQLLPPEIQDAAVRYLVEDIRAHGNRLTCGIMGTGHLLPVLSRFGQTPLAYELALSEKLPSWGFMLNNGATTIWERWNGWTPEKGLHNQTMNSFCHPAFGTVGQWLFQTMAGMDAAEPGFQKIVIRPEPGPGVDWVKASYRSPHGTIASAWKKEGRTLVMDMTIPANTTAVVHLPAAIERSDVQTTESGKPLGDSSGVKVLGIDGDGVTVEVGAGTYHFVMPSKASRIATQ
jgi:alpha-L-rhamnosidase